MSQDGSESEEKREKIIQTRWMITDLKSQEMENRILPDHLDGLQNVDAKDEHEHYIRKQVHWCYVHRP